LVQKLIPHITTLPTPTQININTAPAPILMALIKDLSETDAATLIAARQQQPFKNIQDFITHPTLTGLTIETQSITIASDYFLLTTQVQIDRATAQLHTTLHRLPNRIEVINRY
jgi:general secretion pathway protein K